jgi:hypothetical protein
MTTYPTPAPGTQPPKSGGCLKYALIGCGIVLVIAAIAAVILIAVVFGAVKSTDVYKGARNRAESDPRVIAVLGSPVHAGFLVTGKVSVDNRNGTARINFPVSGPKGKADVHV